LSDGYSALDFALLKDTRLAERVSLQFRGEIFNILNHTNFGIRHSVHLLAAAAASRQLMRGRSRA
jgi:hypothetical protein